MNLWGGLQGCVLQCLLSMTGGYAVACEALSGWMNVPVWLLQTDAGHEKRVAALPSQSLWATRLALAAGLGVLLGFLIPCAAWLSRTARLLNFVVGVLAARDVGSVILVA